MWKERGKDNPIKYTTEKRSHEHFIHQSIPRETSMKKYPF